PNIGVVRNGAPSFGVGRRNGAHHWCSVGWNGCPTIGVCRRKWCPIRESVGGMVPHH
ncbi:unnamed protein product, partial [Staurois parvus]